MHALVSATSGFLLLVLLGHFWGLASHLTGTSQRSVNLTCKFSPSEIENLMGRRSEKRELFELTHGGFSEVPDAASLASGS